MEYQVVVEDFVCESYMRHHDIHSPKVLVHERIAAAQAQSTPHTPATDGENDVAEYSTVERRAEAYRVAINLFFRGGGRVRLQGGVDRVQRAA